MIVRLRLNVDEVTRAAIRYGSARQEGFAERFEIRKAAEKAVADTFTDMRLNLVMNNSQFYGKALARDERVRKSQPINLKQIEMFKRGQNEGGSGHEA